ncbi:hypothetical protein PACTADRAFT_86941 [Pachysolen tannophilus NRRL Y-2460]|uniref:FHA domain-containing protein n=1 Tax=Pachysolen tannophilus NRRL Y-2460 TaxID=669874 RepID=A0A1E4TQA7_PACTA|nr:hypothetical protein PACTADRAFT_86941 [Pachysolen tannophilus NRRL Y-2460]
MWILTIPESQNFNGKITKHWLRPGKTYTIGRSSDSSFIIDKKFISKKHFTIRVGEIKDIGFGSKTPLSLTLESRASTYINKVHYKSSPNDNSFTAKTFQIFDDTEIFFRKKEEVVYISIKWVGINISYSNNNDFSKNYPELTIQSLLERVAKKIDIKISSETKSLTNYYLKSTKRYSNNLIYSLLKGLPIIDENFILKLESSIDKIEENFDTFPNSEFCLNSEELKINLERASMFKNMNFITTNREESSYFEKLISTGQGNVLFYELPETVQNEDDLQLKVNQLVSYISKIPNSILIKFKNFENLKSNLSISANVQPMANRDLKMHSVCNTIQETILEQACEKLNKKLCSLDDLTKAVISVNTAIFFEEYSKRKLGDSGVEGGAVKRRRIGGTQIRKIDPMSLMFGTTKHTQEKFPSDDVEITESIAAKNGNYNIMEVPKKRRIGKSQIKAVDKDMFFHRLDSNPVLKSGFQKNVEDVAESKETERKELDDIDIEMDTNAPAEYIDDNGISETDNRNGEENTNKEDLRKSVVKKFDLEKLKEEIEQEDDSSPENNEDSRTKATMTSQNPFVKAIKKIKQFKQEEEQLGKTESVKPEEASNKGFAVIESIDLILPAEKRQAPSVMINSEWDPSWNGRKNFKIFKKCPTKKQLEIVKTNSRNGKEETENMLSTSFFSTITSYLPLTTYEGEEENRNHGMDIDDEEVEHLKEIGRDRETLSEIDVFFGNGKKNKKSLTNNSKKNGLFVSDFSDNEDLEMEDNQQMSFSNFKNKIQRKDTKDGKLTSIQQDNCNDNNINDNNNNKDDDDDDDDDDGMKFKFTRR